MGIQERKERHRGQLRQEILDVTGELFAEGGYENVSMRKIAERIEYSPTTIYLYFKDKDELLEQICEHTFARLLERIRAVIDPLDDPVNALRRGCREYINFGVDHPHHYRMTFVDPYHSSQYHKSKMTTQEFEQSMGGKAFGFLEQAIEQCISAGRFREMNVREAATSWWALLHGITTLLISEKAIPWMEADRLIEHSFEVMMRGMLPE